MNNGLGYQASAYMSDFAQASSRASGAMFAVAVGWGATPFAVQTAFFHPSNVIKAQLRFQNLTVPHVFTAHQLTVGFIEAAVALAVLLLCQMVFTILFYRWAQMAGKAVTTPRLWPLAAFGVGIVGNAAWFYGTGVFDPLGCVIGLSSAVLTVIAEIVINSLGREFVCGVGSSGQFSVPQLQQFPAAQSGQAPLLYSESGHGPVHYHIAD